MFLSVANDRLPRHSPDKLLSKSIYCIRNMSLKKVILGEVRIEKDDISKEKDKSEILIDRENAGITRVRAAEIAGVNDRTLWKYECGIVDREKMDKDILKRIAVATGQAEDKYLLPYHRWLDGDWGKDIREFVNARTESIDSLSLRCGVTHASLYKWASMIGRPNYQTWELISEWKGATQK